MTRIPKMMKNTLYTILLLLTAPSVYGQFPDEWIFDMRSVPYVLTEEGESFHIELELYEDKDAFEIHMSNCDNFNHLILGNQVISTLVLKDDGEGRDAVAGDLVYTSGALTLGETFIAGSQFTIIDCGIDFYMNNGDVVDFSDINFFADNHNFTIRRLSASAEAAPQLYQAGENVQYTDHVVNVVGTNTFDAQYSCQQFYQYFPDDRQFVYFVPMYMSMHNGSPQSTRIRAPEQGIDFYGDPNYDHTANYGSAGGLERVIRFPDGAETNTGAWAHETKHRWAAFLDHDLHLSVAGNHFSGGFRIGKIIEQINDSTYQFIDNPDIEYNGAWGCYDDLEMYLAGLGSFDAIPFPLHVLLDYSWDWQTGLYISHTGIVDVTAVDFLNSMGPRIPAFEDARKDFKGVLIVNSERFLSAKEMLFFDRLAKAWESHSEGTFECDNFYSITHGAANMEMRLSNLLTASEDITETDDVVTLFPNPASDFIQIETNERIFKNRHYYIYNINGILIKSGQWETALNGNNIDVRDLKTGVYILQFEDVKLRFVKVTY